MPKDDITVLTGASTVERSHLMHRTMGLLTDNIGWTNGLMDYRANGLGLELGLGVR